MAQRIKAVFFDMGGTIEEIYFDRALRVEASRELLDQLAAKKFKQDVTPEAFLNKIISGMKSYKEWAVSTRREAPPGEILSKWVLPDIQIPEEDLCLLAESIMYFWETRFFERKLRREIYQVISELKQRRLTVGVISNTQSYHQVERSLRKYNLLDQFNPVVISSRFGRRKPHPAIFREAVRLAGISPEQAVYVGDTISRDVSGAAGAGFGGAVRIKSYLSDMADKGFMDKANQYGYIAIDSLSQIPDILADFEQDAGVD